MLRTLLASRSSSKSCTPLKSGTEEMVKFIKRSAEFTDGWLSFYWGTTPDELAQRDGIGSAIQRGWLHTFERLAELTKAVKLSESTE